MARNDNRWIECKTREQRRALLQVLLLNALLSAGSRSRPGFPAAGVNFMCLRLLVGLAIAAIAIKGGLEILRDAQ